MTMEVNEEFFGAAVKCAIEAARSPNIEEILAAKHLLRKPMVRHLDCKMLYSKPRILSEEEVKAIFNMEE